MKSMKALIVTMAATLIIGVGGVAYAHHSAAGYNIEKRILISGTIKKVSFRNPHGRIVMVATGEPKEVNNHSDTSVKEGDCKPTGVNDCKIAVVEAASGEVEEWHVETAAANLLRRRGWIFTQVKKGDKVTLVGHPSKDGSNYMYLREIHLPDGTVFGDPEGKDKALD